jgi:hypothetical protein
MVAIATQYQHVPSNIRCDQFSFFSLIAGRFLTYAVCTSCNAKGPRSNLARVACTTMYIKTSTTQWARACYSLKLIGLVDVSRVILV